MKLHINGQDQEFKTNPVDSLLITVRREGYFSSRHGCETGDCGACAVSFGDANRTQAVIAGIQEEGTFWAGGTEWGGHTAMRISFSSWKTTDEDVEKSLDAIKRVTETIKNDK